MNYEHELLTVAEAAKLLRIQPSTLRNWVLYKKLPYVKLGRLVRIRKADCVAKIEASVVPAEAA